MICCEGCFGQDAALSVIIASSQQMLLNTLVSAFVSICRSKRGDCRESQVGAIAASNTNNQQVTTQFAEDGRNSVKDMRIFSVTKYLVGDGKIGRLGRRGLFSFINSDYSIDLSIKVRNKC